MKEKYITIHALPNEEINSWLKWKDGFNFDNIVLRTEADIHMTHFLNVSKDDYEANPDPFRGEYVINKSWLDIEGYFGFQCYYCQIPQTERRTTFYIDFILDNRKVLQIELVTDIIIPNLILKAISKNEILITDYQRQYGLQFQLENIGKAHIMNLHGFIEIIRGSKDLNIQTTGHTSGGSKIFGSSADQLIIATGTGYALIRIGYEYEDFNYNKYRTNTLELVLNKRIKEKSSIPIKGTVQGEAPLITAQT